jgi:G3E family GTPase
MEAIITIVGFLGAGKTTLLKKLITNYIEDEWKPFVILNDYENAYMDAQQFYEEIDKQYVQALSGSCICCSGINELREFVNRIPERKNGITLIEANGTSDACSLMGFLGVGLNERFLPPVQMSVVDAKNWQLRGENNELEANQIQVSSLVVLTHLDKVDDYRKEVVTNEIKRINPSAKVVSFENIDIELLPKLTPSTNQVEKLDHLKAHWSSCSVDLPKLPNLKAIQEIIDRIPKSILRVKGFTVVGNDTEATFFNMSPDREVYVRPFRGDSITGPKLLTIGPGSDPSIIGKLIEDAISAAESNY